MLKRIRIILIIILGPGIIYFGLVMFGGLIPVNREFQNDGNISIYLLKNNSHTDLVLPVSNEIMNWNSIIKQEHFPKPDPTADHLVFGWGDREFYRTTPYWDDLTLSTAARAIFLNTESALHVSQSRRPSSGEMIELKLKEEQYQRLSEYILKHFKFQNGKLTPLDFNYSNQDAFYASHSKFHAFRTCNTWTNSALKYSGIRACLWTAFSFPLFWHNS